MLITFLTKRLNLVHNECTCNFDCLLFFDTVRSSMEPGWLEGTLNGKTGLVPENYVEILP